MVRGVQTQEVDDLPGVTGSSLVAQQVDERVDQEQRERVETRDQESVDRDQLQLTPLPPRDQTPRIADSSYESEVFVVRQTDLPPRRSRSRGFALRYTR
jgi:hypothetical protein